MSKLADFMSGLGQTPPPEPLRVVGIDLGTTNCTVAEIVWEAGLGE